MAVQMFTDEELEGLRGFPEIGREELFRFFTLTPADVAFVDPGRGRGPADRLGLAVTLSMLPWLGFVPDDVASAPSVAVARLAEQLGVDPAAIRSYGRRAKTRTDHLRLAAQYLGWRAPARLELKELDEFLLARAMEHDSPTLLFRLACEFLISAKVIRSGPVTVVKRVAHAREVAQQETFDRLAHEFTDARRAALDGLLVADPAIGTTRLRWLGEGPVEASPAAVKAEIAKLEFLRGMGAHTLDLSVLPKASSPSSDPPDTGRCGRATPSSDPRRFRQRTPPIHRRPIRHRWPASRRRMRALPRRHEHKRGLAGPLVASQLAEACGGVSASGIDAASRHREILKRLRPHDDVGITVCRPIRGTNIGPYWVSAEGRHRVPERFERVIRVDEDVHLTCAEVVPIYETVGGGECALHGVLHGYEGVIVRLGLGWPLQNEDVLHNCLPRVWRWAKTPGHLLLDVEQLPLLAPNRRVSWSIVQGRQGSIV